MFSRILGEVGGAQARGFVCPPGYLAHTGGTFFSALYEYLFGGVIFKLWIYKIVYAATSKLSHGGMRMGCVEA